MTRVRLARVARTHGVRGEVSLGPSALSAAELRRVPRLTWTGRDGSTRSLRLAAVRGHAGRLVVRFDDVASPKEAAALAGGWLEADASSLPDPGPNVAYNFQLVGLEVATEEGRVVGRLAEIWATGAHDVFVVRGEREVLIPAVPEFLKSVSLAAGRIVVRLIPGMEPEAGPRGRRDVPPGAGEER